MEINSFLVEKKWEILKILAEVPSSPIKLAEKLKITPSYVSQQLKLFEAIGLVSKIKTGEFGKGKPRSVYSLTNDFVYLNLLTKNISEKKLIPLTLHHKAILNIWLLDDITFHYPIEKLFSVLEEFLGEIEGVFVEQGFVPKVLVLSGSKEVKTKIDSVVKEFDKKIDYSYVTKSNLSNFSLESLIPIYDPNNFLIKLQKGEKI